MAVGISVTNVANAMLNWLRGTAPATISGLYAALYKGDPGASGGANASAVTTRQQVTMAAASGGSMSMSSVAGSWTMTTTETISHLSMFDAGTAGDFLWSVALNTPRNVVLGDTLTLNTLTLGHSPLAA